ncbi:MAG TPA: class I SAM-dependent methyltransferase [Candidatus Saccharimonadales bacterium]
MNLGERNRQYWSEYEAGTTPGVGNIPSATLLERLPQGARVLDVGTGTGELAEALSKLGLSVAGIDINDHEITANSARETSVTYSTQDITERTNFEDASFDLVLFRYTLTSIHKDQWPALRTEAERITKPGSYVWLAEPGVNDAYASRYALGSSVLGDEHALYVFNDKDLAAKITDTHALEAVIANNQIARIVRHYTEAELMDLFPSFTKISLEHNSDTSPSGYPLDTITMVLQKQEK